MIQKRWTDFSQGTLTQTGSPLDVALYGKGFFAASVPDGRLYTRNGSFRLSTAGQLQTQEGYPVLGADNKPIQLDPSQTVEIDRDGTIHQGGETVARLAVMEFPDLDALSKRGNTYYSLDPSALPARPAVSTEVRQRAIENANEQPAQGAVRLVGVLRQFEMLQRAATLGSTMNKQAIEEVAKV
jgi:flagellar basal body rod protein FlgG